MYCFNVENGMVDRIAVHGPGGRSFISKDRVTGLFVAVYTRPEDGESAFRSDWLKQSDL